MAEAVSRLIMVTIKTSEEMLWIVENWEEEIENCPEIRKKIEELSFLDVDVRHHDSNTKMLASFTDMRSWKLGCFNAFKHRIELITNSRAFRLALFRKGSKVWELNELEVQMHPTADVIELATFKEALTVLSVPKKDGSFRICVNFRHLNKVIVEDIYLLPHIDKYIGSFFK